MSKAKTTKEQSNEHEAYVERLYAFDKARRSANSGALWNFPIDVVGDTMAIECESTEKKSYSLKLSFWEEIVEKTFDGKQPALAIRFRDPYNGKHVDLLVTSIHDDVESRET